MSPSLSPDSDCKEATHRLIGSARLSRQSPFRIVKRITSQACRPNPESKPVRETMSRSQRSRSSTNRSRNLASKYLWCSIFGCRGPFRRGTSRPSILPDVRYHYVQETGLGERESGFLRTALDLPLRASRRKQTLQDEHLALSVGAAQRHGSPPSTMDKAAGIS